MLFGICVLLGNPGLILSVIREPQDSVGLGAIALTSIAIFLGWVIGNALLLLVTLEQFLLERFFSRQYRDKEGAMSTSPAAYQRWLTLTKRLMVIRFGVTECPQDFDPVRAVLPDPLRTEVRGHLSMLATHAMGWAIVLASAFAPALRTWWIYAFAVFLICNGLLHDYYVVKRRVDPEVGDIFRLRAIMREFPKLADTQGPSRTQVREQNDELPRRP